MKTTSLKKSTIQHKWYVIDCSDKIIGRVASEVSRIIQGKNKSNYAPNLNNGDHVILINTSKITCTGKKLTDKLYRKHSGHLGGMKVKPLSWLMSKNANVVMEHAISLMLPKNRMRDVYMTNLHCYQNNEHKHEAQKPEIYTL